MRSTVSIIKIAADRCELSLHELMVITAQSTHLYRGMFPDISPGNDLNEYLLLQDRIKSRINNNLFYKGKRVGCDELVNGMATAWSLLSKCDYATFYNAFSSGRYSEGIFASNDERVDFIDAIATENFKHPVVDRVEHRLAHYNPENPQV